MTHRWAHFGWSLVLPNALTKLQSLDGVHFRSGCSSRGVTMTFLGPPGSLYKPPVDPVWPRVFPEPYPSLIYPQVMQILSFIPVFLLFPLSIRPFRENRPKCIFLHNFREGAPASSVVACTTPTFSGATYIFFSLIWCRPDITSKRGKM